MCIQDCSERESDVAATSLNTEGVAVMATSRYKRDVDDVIDGFSHLLHQGHLTVAQSERARSPPDRQFQPVPEDTQYINVAHGYTLNIHDTDVHADAHHESRFSCHMRVVQCPTKTT